MEKRDRTKRPLAALAVAACLALAAGGTTLAYFVDSETAHNVVTSGGVDVELVEMMAVPGGSGDSVEYAPFPEEGVSGVMPGEEVSKVATVENVGPASAWVRARVSVSAWKDGDKMPAELADGSPAALCEGGSGWTEAADGWWYWGGSLEPGAETLPLFERVAFSKLMPNGYQGCRFDVDVEVQAVQTANNGGSALEAAGWPVAGGAA